MIRVRLRISNVADLIVFACEMQQFAEQFEQHCEQSEERRDHVEQSLRRRLEDHARVWHRDSEGAARRQRVGSAVRHLSANVL